MRVCDTHAEDVTTRSQTGPIILMLSSNRVNFRIICESLDNEINEERILDGIILFHTPMVALPLQRRRPMRSLIILN